MTALEILDELKALGTAQTRKTYARHGITGDMYGVSYADLNKFKKRIKVNHALAQQLWASCNHDARILATMIADPRKADSALLDAWAHDAAYAVLAEALSGFIGQTAFVREKMEQWTQSADEWVGTTGWNVLGSLAMRDESLPDSYFEKYLEIIEQTIHNSKNRVRQAMNNALIAIGTRNSALEQKALGIANRIGKVIVDHGDTDCKTPDAAAYIKKARERQKVKV